MERQKAVIASATLAGSLLAGGLGFALTSGALAGRQDNVGKLQPTSTLVAPEGIVASTAPRPVDTTPSVAGSIEGAPVTVPPATVSKASPALGQGEDHERDEHEYESDGDDD